MKLLDSNVLLFLALFFSLNVGESIVGSPRIVGRTVLGSRGCHFTLNGKLTFLFGISYYGALGAPRDFVKRDLADMKRYGVNWIRVWATWDAFGNDVSAVDAEGKEREPFKTNLVWLVKECDRRGMIVDVTLTRSISTGGKQARRPFETYRPAISTVVGALKPFRNWYLDLANERNQPGRPVYTSMDELVELRRTAKEIAPHLLVTASHALDINKDDLQRYLAEVKLDFISPHRPRDIDSPAQTERKTKEYLKRMKEMGRTVPVHYQEPFRRGWGKWQPMASDYIKDLRGAISGGAAGWCLHNGDQKDNADGQPRRCFDLSNARLFDQLDGEELKALEEAYRVLRHLPP